MLVNAKIGLENGTTTKPFEALNETVDSNLSNSQHSLDIKEWKLKTLLCSFSTGFDCDW